MNFNILEVSGVDPGFLLGGMHASFALLQQH